MPGVRLNFSGRGTSVSLGGRGATLNVGKRGVRQTVGLPGTGMSYSEFHGWNDGTPRTADAADSAAPQEQGQTSSGGGVALVLFVLALVVLIAWLAG
jgi:hypothetical protein